MLEIADLVVRYRAVTAVAGVSLACAQGEVVAVVGPNGAGKSSLLNAISGALAPGNVRGSVRLDGVELARCPPERIVRAGIALVPEGRRIFAGLTVAENLSIATVVRRDRAAVRADVHGMLERFPALAQHASSAAGVLSGGQQQQLAIARALLARPRVLLLDEPSLGLAPLVIDEIFAVLAELRHTDIAIVLVEQLALRAMQFADRAFLLRNGHVEAASTSTRGEEMIAAYFGSEIGVTEG